MRAFETHFGEAHSDVGEIGVLGFGQMGFGEEAGLLRLVFVLAEEFDSLSPGGFLGAVEFAQIEDLPLQDSPTADAATFNNAPVVMLFAVLVTFLAT
jgi:hypothetical protein